MTSLQGKTSILLILAFILSFGFGMVTMHMDDSGDMSNCPFADSGSICPMSLTEHIAIFQGVFSAIPSKILLSLMLVLAFFLILFSDSIPGTDPPPKSVLFSRNNPRPIFTDKFLLALSDGIIQSKLYA